MSSLMDCIKSIPSAGMTLLGNRASLESRLSQLSTNEVDEIVVVGSGSSYNAGLFVKDFSETQMQIKVSLFLPNDFVNYTNKDLLNPKALYVFLSQSGTTRLVVEAMDIVKQQGYKTVALTEDIQSVLSLKSDIAVDIQTGFEAYRFRTLGFTTTCVSLYQLILGLASQQDRFTSVEIDAYYGMLTDVISTLESVRLDSVSWYELNKEALMSAETYIFTAAGPYWPVMKEADIKFMEMLPELTNSFELEEIIHGPQNMFKKTQGFFILSDEGVDEVKAHNVATFIKEAVGGRVFHINKDALKSIQSLNDFTTLQYLMFFQVMAFQIADARGKDLKQGTYPMVTDYVSKSI